MFPSEGESHTDTNTFHAAFAVCCCCAGAFLTSCPGAGQRQRLLSECTQLKETSSQPSASSLLLLYTVYLCILKPAQLTWDWVFPKGDFENIQCSAFIWQNVLLMFLYGSCLVIFGSVLSRVFFNLFTECSVSWNQAFHFI